MLQVKKSGVFYYLLILLICIAFGYLSLGGGFNFKIYCSFSGDGFAWLSLIKGIQENGIFGAFYNYRIGTPHGASLLDFPATGNITIAWLWLLSFLTDSPQKIAYLYLIVTFAVDGLSMAFLLKRLNIRYLISTPISILFSIAPYHFYRYLGHATLTDYSAIPLVIFLSFVIIDLIHEYNKVLLIFVSVYVGLSYGYFYAFGLILLAIAYCYRGIVYKNIRTVFRLLWIGVTILLTIFLSLLPKIIYSVLNGVNSEAGIRSFIEQEIYGLKIIQLLLPVSYEKIHFLSHLTDKYSKMAPLVTENCFASLGIIASIGFLGLSVYFFISFVRKPVGDSHNFLDFISLSTLCFILFGTIGGFGEIFNWIVTAQIRCYNRSSIVIMCFALLFIAYWLNELCKIKAKLGYLVCFVVFVVGVFDQYLMLPKNWQAPFKSTQRMYEAYFASVEHSLPANSMVYQLPFMKFPENGPINHMNDYAPFLGYLFTDNLKWSYGAVRGRDKATADLNVDNGIGYRFLDGIKKAGFSGVYIDTDGYSDGGRQITEFYNSTGLKPLISGDGKLYVYDISNVDIPSEYTVPGFTAVKLWAIDNKAAVDNGQIKAFADGLVNSDVSVLNDLFDKIFAGNDAVVNGSNREFVDFCYNTLLNRGESPQEQQGWVDALKNGATRQSVAVDFLRSAEFKNRIK